jgi:hypothetical protein
MAKTKKTFKLKYADPAKTTYTHSVGITKSHPVWEETSLMSLKELDDFIYDMQSMRGSFSYKVFDGGVDVTEDYNLGYYHD